jgi:hypothetical protein
MVIQCALSGSLNSIWDCVSKNVFLSPLPGCIMKRSAFVGKESTSHTIFILYEVDKANFAGAMEYICKHLNSLPDVSGCLLSAHSYGPPPPYFFVLKGADKV